MKRVIIESPYAGNVEENIKYLGECVRHSLDRGESPYASHGFFTQFLDDTDPEERSTGIVAGQAWMEAADYVVVYADLGISSGMRLGIERAQELGKLIVLRFIRQGRG